MNYSKSICILIMIILVLNGLLTVTTAMENDNEMDQTINSILMKNTRSYTSHPPIRINNSTEFAAKATAEGWLGNGTQGAPYIISDYEIDGTGYGYCLFIGNTSDYFIARNCSMHNASGNSAQYYEDSGVYLFNVTNGIIKNCTFRDNDAIGLYLHESQNNTIIGCNSSWNTIGIGLWRYSNYNNISNCRFNNNIFGIYLSNFVNNSNISSCISNNNDFHGIYIGDQSDNNTLFNCTCNDNNDDGIYIEWSCDYTIIYNCSISNNTNGVYSFGDGTRIINCSAKDNKNGINIEGSSGNIVLNCTSQSKERGIYLRNSESVRLENNMMFGCGIVISGNPVKYWNTHNISTTNLVNNKPVRYFKNQTNVPVASGAGQVIIANCTKMTVMDQTISNCSVGILLGFSSQCTISNSVVTDCINGIELILSDNNLISNCTCEYNNLGIHVVASNIKIRNCTNNNNSYGIISDGVKNIIENCTCEYNNFAGIIIQFDNNNISNCICNHNGGSGISLNSADNSNISNCICNHNGGSGISLNSADNNNISNSKCNNNDMSGIILELGSNNNNISNCTYKHNKESGIHLEFSSDDNNISRCISENNTDGFYLKNSLSNSISNCTSGDNENSIYLWFSETTHLENNLFSNDGVRIAGNLLKHWNTHTISTNNLVNDKPLQYLKNKINAVVAPGAGQIITANCTKMNVTGQTIFDTNIGIQLAYSNQCRISNCTINDSIYGIRFYMSDKNILNYNNLNRNSDQGCYLDLSNKNKINNNDFRDSRYGIELKSSDDNVINNNMLRRCDQQGCYLGGSNNNLIYHNNFRDNNVEYQVYDDGTNSWNLSYPSGGNYWDDYTGVDQLSGPSQNISEIDGIGDTPYIKIDGGTGAKDYYPLMEPTDLLSYGSITITSHDDGELIKGTVLIEAAVTASEPFVVHFYVNDELKSTDVSSPYQFILDTTIFMEDTVIQVDAVVVLPLHQSLRASVNLTVNNEVQSGDYISVSTLATTYQPDQDISVIVSLNSPPTFDSLNLLLNYTDPAGNELQFFNQEIWPGSTKKITILTLPSDALQGTYTINARALGYVHDALFWEAESTTTFMVSGKNIHEFLKDINVTVNTLLNRVSNLESELAKINTSLHQRIDILDTDFLSEFAKINSSGYTKIEQLINNISNDIIGLNLSFTEQITSLLENITDDNDALRAWFEAIITSLEAQLETLNITSQIRLEELQSWMLEQYLLLETNLTAMLDRLGEDYQELNDTISSLRDMDLEEIKTAVLALADNISTHDQSVAYELSLLALDIAEMQAEFNARLENINNTQKALDQIEQTLSNLEELDTSLEEGQNDLQSGSDDQSTKLNIQTVLLIIILIIVILLFIIVLITRRKEREVQSPEEEETTSRRNLSATRKKKSIGKKRKKEDEEDVDEEEVEDDEED